MSRSPARSPTIDSEARGLAPACRHTRCRRQLRRSGGPRGVADRHLFRCRPLSLRLGNGRDRGGGSLSTLAGYLAGGDLAVLVLAVLSTFAGVAAAAVMEQRLGYQPILQWSSTRSRDSWSRWSFCR